MSAADVLYDTLTALFAAAVMHTLRHGAVSRSPRRHGQGDHLLYGTMALHGQGHGAVDGDACCAVRRFQMSRPTANAPWLPYAAGMALMAWTMHSPAGPSREILAAGSPGQRLKPRSAVISHRNRRPAVRSTEVLALPSLYAPSGPLTRGSSSSARRRHSDR